MSPRPSRRAAALVALLAGCAPEAPDAGPSPAVADAPFAAKADGFDAADRDCQIVLREVARIPDGGPGFVTTDGGQWRWVGAVDVDDDQLADGATVRVLYHSTAAPGWWSVAAEASAGAGPGFTRFTFTLDEHVFGPGLSGTGLSRSQIDLIPYVEAGRARLFDHNRRPGDFDSYTLALANQWAVGDDAAICPAGPDRPAPAWIGNVVTRIGRDGGHPCDGGARMDQGFTYDTWVRQRAIVRNVCFEVWAPGITDWFNPDLWKQLDVQLHARASADGPFTATYVDLLDQPGNNARYRVDLRGLDPFEFGRCPAGPVRRVNGYDEADLFFYFTVNGAELRPEGGGEFHGVFADYPDNAWRAERCQ